MRSTAATNSRASWAWWALAVDLLEEEAANPPAVAQPIGVVDVNRVGDHVDVGATVIVGLGGIGLAARARAIQPDGKETVAELHLQGGDDPLDDAALGIVERGVGEGLG
jgi:hypothetical protein